MENIIPRNVIINRGLAKVDNPSLIINLGCTLVDNHIPRDDIFDYHPRKIVNFILLY